MRTIRSSGTTLALVWLLFFGFLTTTYGANVSSPKEALAAAISAPAPEYPEAARRNGVTGSGTVVVHANIATGAVTRVEVAQSTGNQMLDRAAVSAFQRWRFRPGIISEVRFPVTFTAPGQDFRFAKMPGNLSANTVNALLAATTPSGKTLSEAEVRPLILHASMPSGVATASRNWRVKIGVFLLSVAADGMVEKVETLQSTGHGGLDGEILRSLKNWRFRPNSVKEVRVPASYGFISTR